MTHTQQKMKVKGQAIQKLEWKHTGQTERWTDTTEFITCLANNTACSASGNASLHDAFIQVIYTKWSLAYQAVNRPSLYIHGLGAVSLHSKLCSAAAANLLRVRATITTST